MFPDTLEPTPTLAATDFIIITTITHFISVAMVAYTPAASLTAMEVIMKSTLEFMMKDLEVSVKRNSLDDYPASRCFSILQVTFSSVTNFPPSYFSFSFHQGIDLQQFQ
jgi:hypothetical protein